MTPIRPFLPSVLGIVGVTVVSAGHAGGENPVQAGVAQVSETQVVLDVARPGLTVSPLLSAFSLEHTRCALWEGLEDTTSIRTAIWSVSCHPVVLRD